MELFFDDFTDGSLRAEWHTYGTVSEADGVLKCSLGAGENDAYLPVDLTTYYDLRFKFQRTSQTWGDATYTSIAQIWANETLCGLYIESDGTLYFEWHRDDTGWWNSRCGDIGVVAAINTWFTIRLVATPETAEDASDGTFQVYLDGVLVKERTGIPNYLVHAGNGQTSVDVGAGNTWTDGATSSGEIQIDDFAIYVAPATTLVSQVVIESLSNASVDGRVSQVVIEALSDRTVLARVSQLVIETLSPSIDPFALLGGYTYIEGGNTPGSGWVDIANFVDVEIRAAHFPDGLAHVRVTLWTGDPLATIKARLWNAALGVSLGESDVVTGTTPVTVEIPVVLTEPLAYYRVQVTSNLAAVDLWAASVQLVGGA
jgi:hypothetical protein